MQADRRYQLGGGPPAMRALSIRQPWLWAILHGGKTVENRDWAGCEYRGPILLHASKSCGKAEFSDAVESIQYMRRDLGFGRVEVPALDQLPRGSLCGIARIVNAVRHPAMFPGTGGNEEDFAQGFRMAGALGLELADVRELPEVPYKGALGFFAVALDEHGPGYGTPHKRVYEDAWRELAAASRRAA